MKSVYLELTHQCNLRCPHCYNMSGEDRTELSQEVLFNLFRAIGKDSQNNWQVALSGGEPLIRKDIHEILRECVKYPNIKEVVNKMLEKYDGIPEIVEQDLKNFIDKLRINNFTEVQGANIS